MKSLLVLAALTLSIQAQACPDISGEWSCSDSSGETWTESNVVNGNAFTVIYDKGTDREQKEEFVADGRVINKTTSINDYTDKFATAAAEKAMNLLPAKQQALLLKGMDAFRAKLAENFKGEGRFNCEANTLKGTYDFKGQFSMPMVFALDSSGTAEMHETLAGNVREGSMKIVGTATAAPAKIALFSSIEPKTEPLDSSLTMKCVRK